MKYIILILPLLLLIGCDNPSNSDSGETEEEKSVKWNKEELADAFERDLRDMVACLNIEDYSCVVDYMPEQMLRIMPKEMIVSGFEQMSNMGMHMKFDVFDITKISDVVQHDGYYYSKLDISSKTTVTLTGAMQFQKEELMDSFSEQGAEISELDNGEFDYTTEESIYAIADEKTKTWKYVRFNQSSKEQVNLIVPVQVRTRLN